jgi:hypothetical protein
MQSFVRLYDFLSQVINYADTTWRGGQSSSATCCRSWPPSVSSPTSTSRACS